MRNNRKSWDRALNCELQNLLILLPDPVVPLS